MSNQNLECRGSSGVFISCGVIVRVPFEQAGLEGLGRQPEVFLGLGRLLGVHLQAGFEPATSEKFTQLFLFQADLLVNQKINKENKEHIGEGRPKIHESP